MSGSAQNQTTGQAIEPAGGVISRDLAIAAERALAAAALALTRGSYLAGDCEVVVKAKHQIHAALEQLRPTLYPGDDLPW